MTRRPLVEFAVNTTGLTPDAYAVATADPEPGVCVAGSVTGHLFVKGTCVFCGAGVPTRP